MSDSSDEEPISTWSAAGAAADRGASSTGQQQPIVVDSSDDEILGFNNKPGKKPTTSITKKKKISPKHSPKGKKLSPKSAAVDDVPCEVCGKNDNPDKTVLCDCCDQGASHIYCCDPPMRKVSEDEEWLCKHCKAMVKGDPYVRCTALVSAYFEKYGTCVGEVCGVRYAQPEPDVPGKRGGNKQHKIFYPGDGTEMWHDLKAKHCDEKIIPINEELTQVRSGP